MFILFGKATIQMNCGYYIIHRLFFRPFIIRIYSRKKFMTSACSTLYVYLYSLVYGKKVESMKRQHFFEHIIIQYIRKSTTELLSDFSDILDSPKP